MSEPSLSERIAAACPCRLPNVTMKAACGGVCSCSIGEDQGSTCGWPGHAVEAEVGELGREVLGLRAVLGDPKECSPSPSEIIWVYRDEIRDLNERAEAAERLLAETTDKLQRTRDALKHQANSEGGLVAEVDMVLARVRDAVGKT